MTREEKYAYRRKRNGIGWALAGAWVLYWCMQQTDGSFSAGAGYYFMVLVAIVTSPFAFLISGYIARAMVEGETRKGEAQQAAAEAAARRQEQTERTQRARLLEDGARQAHAEIERGEFIRKLGAVGDYLKLLPRTTDPDRIGLIEQSIDRELRELIAKYEPEAIRVLVRDDEAVRFNLSATLQALEQQGPLSVDAAFLTKALRGDASGPNDSGLFDAGSFSTAS